MLPYSIPKQILDLENRLYGDQDVAPNVQESQNPQRTQTENNEVNAPRRKPQLTIQIP